mgnify:CR=1 FL=1
MKTLNNRTRRVGENIRAVLSKQIMLREHQILEKRGVLITVTEVQPSADLRYAKVFISCIGEDKNYVVKTLNSFSSLFSRLVAQELETKYSPKLSFFEDTSFEQAKKINDLIDQKK